MANKFQVTGQILTITDTVTNKTLVKSPKADLFYYIEALESTIPSIKLYDISGANSSGGATTFSCLLSTAIDSSDVPFTVETFKTFADSNLGFKAASLETDPIYGSSEAALFVSGDKAKLDTVTNKWNLQGNAGTNPATDFIGTTDAQPLIFKTNGVERARFTGGTSTNLGLGTTTPTYGIDNQVDWLGAQYGQMALGKTGQAGGITFRRGSDGSPQATIGYSSQTESSNFRISSSGGGGFLTFWCSSSERVRIDANGNFGIGVTSPTDKLHVQGTARITGAIKDSTNSAGTSGQGLSSSVTGTSWGWFVSALGTTGTDINLSNNILNIPTASATNRGALSSADWSTFNNKLGSSNFIDKEIPTGLINGTNTTFTLANTPIVGSEHIYRNGLLQESGAGNDYTISGATITYLTAPLTGDKLRITYRR